MTVHEFGRSLARSHSAEDLPVWEQVYRQAFIGVTAIVNHRKSGEHQLAGIDRSVILENSKQILIDEKVRYRNEKTGRIYEDIALEYLSDADRGVPGWVCKRLRCDYIAYLIAPLGVCHFLPVLQLQQAWLKHSARWLSEFPKITAHNISQDGRRPWRTLSCCVPTDVLYPAIGSNLRVKFEPFEEAA